MEGLRFVRHTPSSCWRCHVVGFVATVGMNFNVLIPPLAQNVLDSDAAGFGFLMTASGVGSLDGRHARSCSAAGRGRSALRPGPSPRLAVARAGVHEVVPVSLVLMVLVGFGRILMAATGNTTIQLAVPDRLRGRVMSVYTTVFTASVPLGGIAMGAIASALGVPVAIAIGGVLSLVTGLGALAWWRAASARPCQPGLGGRGLSAARPSRWRRRRRGLSRPPRTPAPRSARRTRTRSTAPAGRPRPGRPAAARAAAPPSQDRAHEVDRRGAQPSGIASAQIAASIAPDAPSGCPYSALVPLTGTVGARSPSASAIARASATSPIGVDDAWALT